MNRGHSRGRSGYYSAPSGAASAAFSRLDLLFVLAALALFTVTALSHQNIGPRTERMVCGNNLRQVGVAFQEWSDAFDENLPWELAASNGGTGGYPNNLMDNAWYHFASISNQLSNPALLACPSDNARPAKNWDTGTNGFLNPSFRNNALSYLVGCHAEIRLPTSVLSSDRNIIPDSVGSACSVGFRSVASVSRGGAFYTVAWNSTNMHSGSGNLLLSSGSVAELSSPALRSFFAGAPYDGPASHHFLLPR